MTIAYAELFTPSLLKDPDEGRALIQALTALVSVEVVGPEPDTDPPNP